MKKNTINKIITAVIILTIIGGGYGAYMFFQPHRDVKKSKTDFITTASSIVEEYLIDANLANTKYLADDGDSKIFEITGTVKKIFKNLKGDTVILLDSSNSDLGVECTFLEGENTENVEIGNTIKIKGAIERGASYDEDLEIGEDVLIGKCSLVK